MTSQKHIPTPSPSEKSIGRPDPWREGRYEEKGDPARESVKKDPGEGEAPADTTSTPVTQKDYTG